MNTERAKHKLAELRGLGKEIWQSRDIDSYIQNERASWDLEFLEEYENQAFLLENFIKEGTESGVATNFDPAKHLESLKNRIRE